MKHDRDSADGQALPSALKNPPLATTGNIVVQQIQAAPALLSEDNQTICPREEWRGLLRRLGVPFTTPRRGLNIVVAADLEAAIRSGAKPFPRKTKARALAAVPAVDNDNDDAVIAALARANGRTVR
jgi:hypothetical protein